MTIYVGVPQIAEGFKKRGLERTVRQMRLLIELRRVRHFRIGAHYATDDDLIDLDVADWRRQAEESVRGAA